MRIIGIDPGSEISGICMIGPNLEIYHASNTPNEAVLRLLVELSEFPEVHIAIESLAPYASRLSSQTIETAMWIGELRFRIKTELYIEPVLIPRNSVKYWIYNTAPEVCIPRVIKRIAAIDKRNVGKGKKGLKNAVGKMREPSFNYVDDRNIIAGVKHIAGISTPKPGQRNEFGLHSHSWQAAALAMLQANNLMEAALNDLDKKGQKEIPAE